MITKREFIESIKHHVKDNYQHRYDYNEAISKCYATGCNLCEVMNVHSKTGNTVTFEVMDHDELD